jgi:hypothetical protein
VRPIDEQASTVLARIEPAADRVRVLVDSGDVEAGLMMVRWFDDPDGGYNAMGWWLTREQIQLLARMSARPSNRMSTRETSQHIRARDRIHLAAVRARW